MSGMEDNEAKFPDKTFEIQRAIEGGDLVATHSRVQMKPGQRALAAVHIFRFEGERIAEFWDVVQEVPEQSPNAYGMF